jgi:DNA-binding transcriptional MocR family regulator
VAVHYQIDGGTAADIAVSVEAGVTHGSLRPGASLPPVRVLAGSLGVSPNTVAAAYRLLRDRGLVETAGRNGTRVRSRPPIASREVPVPAPGLVDLSGGEPDPELLPDPAAALTRIAPHAGPVGYVRQPLPDLLDAARVRLRPVPTEHLTVTSGTLDGIERVLSAHLKAGDRVAVEDPGWANLLDLLAALRLHPLPVPVDDDGPAPAALDRALRHGARAFILTCRAQNPTGAQVSRQRAAELRSTLRAYPRVLVIEDDHAAELADGPLHPIAGATDTWAFLRSVSKPLGPDLRLAILAGDETTVARVEGRLRLGAGWVSLILQRIVREMWSDPAVSARVTLARDEYARRRTALTTALAARGVPAWARSGINVWVPVVDETFAVTRVRDAGFAVAPGSLYRIAPGPAGAGAGRAAVRVSLGPLRPHMVAPLADALAAVPVRPAR